MKEHTSNFETEIKTYGREQAVQVIFEQDGQQVVLDNENVFSVTPNFKASLLKSAMKSLILDCNVEIPVGTRLQFKYGILVNNAYEYLDFGYYIVNKIEKKEDTRSYEITCYDKMMLAMVDYIDIGIEYPITIRNYIAEICNHLEIDFGSNQDQFVNYDKEIPSELYLDANGNSLGYTFRDVLDELSQVTASVICIDENDQLVVRYPTETNKIIDEDYLKNINVNFGEKYGPINSLVIARAADSDFIYKEDEQSIAENGLCEVKISDNQILNDDSRVQFIDAMFNQLRGTEFYLNDFSSTGIAYLDLLDYYEVKVFDNYYKCLMLNDEINITQGLQEQVFTERPKESETEYKSLSKQDQSILRTGIKVNKVEGEIQSVVEQIGDRSQKTTTITQDIDGIEEIVQDYQDLTETKYAIGTINFENVNRSVPIFVRIHPTYTDIVGVVPSTRLYPSNSLYPDEKYKALHFYNVTEDEDIIYRLPCNLYYLNSNVYDEFIIDFDEKKCYLIRRVQITNGIKTALQEEQIIYFSYPDIALTDGDYSIYVISDSYVEVKLMKQNDFTKQFATEVEMQSSITMTNRAIQLEVEQRQRADENLEDDITAKLELKVDIDDNDQVVSMINASADVITLNSNRLVINSTYFQLDENGNITATSGDIGGFTIGTDTLSCDITTTIGPFTSADQERVQKIVMKEITPTSADIEKYDIDGDGEIDILDYSRIRRAVMNGGYYTYNGTFTLDTNNYFNTIKLESDGSLRTIGIGSASLGQVYLTSCWLYNSDEPNYSSYASPNGVVYGDSENYNQASLSADNSGAELSISLDPDNYCSLSTDGEYSRLVISGGTPSIYLQGTTPEITFNDNGTTANITLDNGYIYPNKLKVGYTKAYYNYTEYTGTTFNTANDLYIATTNSSGSSVTGYLHCRIVNGIICSV